MTIAVGTKRHLSLPAFCALLMLQTSVAAAQEWATVGHANNVAGLAAVDGTLFAATVDGGLWVRPASDRDLAWRRIGHANQVVDMAYAGGKLWAATRDNGLWSRPPSQTDVAWQRVGHANSTAAMTGSGQRLFAATTDNKLWSKLVTDGTWRQIGHANNLTAMTVVGSTLYATSRDNLLWRRSTALAEENWVRVGSVRDVRAMTSSAGTLYAATTRNQLLAFQTAAESNLSMLLPMSESKHWLLKNLTTRKLAAEFTGRVQNQGSVTAGSVTWDCSAHSCKSTTRLNATVELCRDLVQIQKVSVSSFGHGSRQLSSDELARCNEGKSIRIPNYSILGNIPPNLVVARDSADAEERIPGPSANGLDIVGALIETNSRIETDFEQAMGWDSSIWSDGQDDNVFYYLPREYRISIEVPDRNLALTFNHEIATERHGDKTVLMRAQLRPPRQDGDLRLLVALARRAIEDLGGRDDVTLKPYPIASARVELEALANSLGISSEDVSIATVPNDIRDPITIFVRMDEPTKENLVAMMRSGPLGGRVHFESSNGSVVETNIILSLRDLSGEPVPTLSQLRGSERLTNNTFFPVRLNGIVAYVSGRNGQLSRQYLPFQSAVTLIPGQSRGFPYPGSQFSGTPVHGWFDYDVDSNCEDCLADLERKALSMAGLTKREELVIEALPAVFDRLDIAKINVEVRSYFFDASGTVQESRVVRLYPDNSVAALVLFLDRDRGADETRYEYRTEAYLNSGERIPFSSWQSAAVMDLTLTPADFSNGL
jgi:hypothetical protein